MNSTRVADFRLQDWLPHWLSVDDLIAGMAALAMLTVCLAVWNTLRVYNPYERRFAQIAQRKESLRRAALETPRYRERITAAGLMTEVVDRLNLMRTKHATDARMMLAQAGMRSRDAVVKYLFARVALPVVFGFVLLADGYGPHILPIPPRFQLIGALVAVLLGYLAPGIYLRNMTNKRAHQLQLGLPDGLDLMVICAEAGLSLDASLTRVARELEPTWPEVSEELGITAAELTFLPDRRLAFENLNARTNSPSIRGVVNTLQQTAKFGTPLAQSLRVLAAEFREARITRAEEKAARLPAMLTVPMILFILPTLFIVLLGPAALGVIDTFSGKKQAQQTTTASSAGSKGGGGGVSVVTSSTRSGGADQEAPTVEVTSSAGSSSHQGGLLELMKPTVRMSEPVVVDLDARPLGSGFRHRLALVPAGTSDSVSEDPEFARDSVPVQPSKMRVMLVPRKAGRNEVRLYYIPQFASKLVLVARKPVEVTAGAPGATEASWLIAEAGIMPSPAFEASHRGQNLAIEGQYLRTVPLTAAQLAGLPGIGGTIDADKSYTGMFLGWTLTPTKVDGSPAELVCVVPADDPTLRDRGAALRQGEPIVVRGTPSGWGKVSGSSTVIVGNCRPAP